jgi:hypothetical protein
MLEDRSCHWNPLFERISVGSRETWELGWAGREPRQEESLAQEGVGERDRRSRFFYAKQASRGICCKSDGGGENGDVD